MSPIAMSRDLCFLGLALGVTEQLFVLDARLFFDSLDFTHKRMWTTDA
ncbi:hypothetical protein [Roseiconus lacunae]|nr:hypothetical protein [Roseiconus lacunae]